MKMKFKKIYIVFLIALAMIMFNSCKFPNPLIGTWIDNAGSKLTLLPDNSFSARIKNSYEETQDYKGTYNVIADVISFSTETGYQVVSEWDIRGAKLYFIWPDTKGQKLQLTLYRQSK